MSYGSDVILKTSWRFKGIGQRIRARRKELGLSQREIQDPGITYAYISRVEAGKRRPSLDALIALGEKLDVTGLYLLTGDEHAHCPLCKPG